MENVLLNMPAATLVRLLRSEGDYFDTKEENILVALKTLAYYMEHPTEFLVHPEALLSVLNIVNDYWVLLRNLTKAED